MEPAEQLSGLCELAREAGLQVRAIAGRSGGEGEPTAASAVCRIRGEVWVVLSATDSVEQRIAVVAGALREFASEWLERRYVPPALRARLGTAEEPP